MRQANVQVEECPQDPRRRLVETKHFSLRPQPLQRWLYRQDLSRTAEHVYWLHFDAGYLNGDFISEIPLEKVAAILSVSKSTVTRAYWQLEALNIVRRTEGPPDRSNPFNRGVKITEVFLPRDAMAELFSAPNRGKPVKAGTTQSAVIAAIPAAAAEPSPQSPQPTSPAREVDVNAAWARCKEELKSCFSDSEFATWVLPLQPHIAGRDLVLYAPNQFVIRRIEPFKSQIETAFRDEGGAGQVRIRMGSATDPVETGASPAAAKQGAPAARRLDVFTQARLRSQLSKLNLGRDLDDRFDEIAWSMLKGALAKFDMPLALNIGVKKVRDEKWTRPKGMPVRWKCTRE